VLSTGMECAYAFLLRVQTSSFTSGSLPHTHNQLFPLRNGLHSMYTSQLRDCTSSIYEMKTFGLVLCGAGLHCRPQALVC
jgi:hypothetical protein